MFARSAAPDCGQPEVPVYGRVAGQQGGAVTYSCSQGYTLLGPATRNCSQQGWQGPVPVCKGGPLPSPTSSCFKSAGKANKNSLNKYLTGDDWTKLQ